VLRTTQVVGGIQGACILFLLQNSIMSLQRVVQRRSRGHSNIGAEAVLPLQGVRATGVDAG
jgi:hypothetical protein